MKHGWRYLAFAAAGATLAAGLTLAAISGVDVPPGWATLLGAVIGLSAIAWQTRAGFGNLIKSQEHSAVLDRDARNERARLDREGREHQYQLDTNAREAAKESEKKELAAALHGELISINRQYNNVMQVLLIQEKLFRQMALTGTAISQDFKLLKISTPVYEANIHRIGLLGPSVAADVAEIYGAMSFGFELPAKHLDPEMLSILLDGIRQSLSSVNKDALHVNSRLLAIQFGSEDPGPLLFARQRRSKTPATEGTSEELGHK